MCRKNIIVGLSILVLSVLCLKVLADTEITEESKGKIDKDSLKIEKLAPKNIIINSIKTATGAVAAGVLAAFVYDSIKPSSINEESKTLTFDYPFFATTENNERVPMEGGSYNIVNRTDKSISIEGSNNQVMLVKIGSENENND